MIWYVIIFLICFIFMIITNMTKDEKTKKILEVIILIILIIFSGTRYKLGGWDYENYHTVFKESPKLSNFDFNIKNVFNMEKGYILLNSIVKTLGFNFFGFTLIHSIIFYILLYKAIKKYNINFNFFIIVFLYKTCIFNTFVSMRQSLVLVIFFNALYYLLKNERLKYVLCIIPCLFIHSSALILLPLIFIDKINFSKKALKIYGIIFLMFFMLNILNIYKFDILHFIKNTKIGLDFENKINQYSRTTASINILSTLEVYLIYIFIVMFFKKIYNRSEESKLFCNLFLLSIPIVTLFRSSEIMVRFRDYFMLFEPFVLYYILFCFKGNSKKVYLLIVTLLCLLGMYRYVYMYDSGEFALKNYQSYITKNISIFGDE